MTSAATARRQETARTEPRPRPASIHDVARLAGVSNQTISRVLNEHPGVRGSTRDRVLAAMDALRYRPNRAARMLGTRRSQIIGVLTADAGSRSGQASSVRVIEEAARERGYYASVVHLSSASASAISAAAEDLLGQEVEGVVIVAPQLTVVSGIAPLLARIPIVTSLGELRNAGAVTAPPVDAGGGARLAVRHLIEQGHRRIVHVAGPLDWHDAQSRLGPTSRSCGRRACACCPPSSATGAPTRGTRPGAHWPGTGRERAARAGDSPPSSPPATSWRSVSCTPSVRPGWTSRPMSAWPGWATSPRRRTSGRR